MDDEQNLPPTTQIGMASLALIVAGGIYLSAHLPKQVPLAPAAILLAVSAALMVFNLFALSRVKNFPWHAFFAVAKWSMLAYLVIAGMIEYVFLLNNVSGGVLVILTLSLAVFSIHVPVLIGFTVAQAAMPPAAPAPAA
jgi:hypothetical protein